MKTITIRTRLTLSLLLATFTSLGLTLNTLYSVTKGNEALSQVYDGQVQPTLKLQEMYQDVNEIHLRIADVLLDQTSIVGAKNYMEEVKVRIPQTWNDYKKMSSIKEGSGGSTRISTQVSIVNRQIVLLPEFLNQISIALSQDDKKKLSHLLEDEWPQFYTGLIKPLIILQGAQVNSVKNTYDQEVRAGRSMIWVGWSIFAFAVVMGLASFFIILRSVVLPLREAIGAAQSVAKGDLSHPIPIISQDEIGQLLSALKEMQRELGIVVERVQAGAGTIASSAREIASGNGDLSRRTEEQAAHLEETAANLEELVISVRKNTQITEQGKKLAGDSVNQAIKSGSGVQKMMEVIKDISSSSQKISGIVGIIEGFSFQTNILALNAAVEAARAGEQGRGFAVVASEIRSLALRSSAAAKEIKELIDTSLQKIEDGALTVTQNKEIVQDMIQYAERVTELMTSIAETSEAQKRGIEEVNQRLAQMDDTTQQNAALVEEAHAASESMQDQTELLREAVGVFKLKHD